VPCFKQSIYYLDTDLAGTTCYNDPRSSESNLYFATKKG
jgi:hypothetical protein